VLGVDFSLLLRSQSRLARNLQLIKSGNGITVIREKKKFTEHVELRNCFLSYPLSI